VHPDELLADLDPDQRAAVTAEGSLVAVIAGAGSGKTRVLTRRIAYRIAIDTADARHTLALTFTRQAAGELRRRLRAAGLRDHVEAGTFHSVMLALLRQRWADTDRRPRTVVTDRRRLLRDVLSAGDRRPSAPAFEALLAELDWATSRGFDGAAYRRAVRENARRPSTGVDTAARVIEGYRALKASRGIIDFDDVLALAARELEDDPSFMDATRWRFRHLLVDEAQDLNPLQHRVIDLLRAGRDDLFLVGDPAQAIYGFNGADPTLLVDIENRFAGVEVIRLPVNHRSTPQIVAAGTHVLERSRQPAALASGRSDGDMVELHRSDDAAAEAAHIARLARRVDPNLLRNGELAVLARTNAQLDPIGDALQRAGLPVRRSSTNANSPLQTAIREAAANSSASRLRAWAHDTLDDLGPTDPPGEPAAAQVDAARSRVAATALEFLREHPLGDGATFRAWVATSQVFETDDRTGVELLTFHAAKGREWHTVIVSGVESSLVPHKSATTAATRAEEARLLYVALTRATDRLHVTSAARRGGYARTPSPLLADFEPVSSDVPPPPRPRERRRPDPLLTALREWRLHAARRADMLPDQLCSARDLSAIAAGRPADAAELEALTSFGPITARRLAPQILEIVATTDS
jgi:DNA helicase-2/ATP-dependent DNA helicase PcrA